MSSPEPSSLMMDFMKKVKRANHPQLLSYHEVKIYLSNALGWMITESVDSTVGTKVLFQLRVLRDLISLRKSDKSRVP